MGLVTEERVRDAVILRFSAPAKALASTVVGGGLRRVEAVLIQHVDDIGPDEDPVTLAREHAVEKGLNPSRSAVFLTAADLPANYRSRESGSVFAAVSLGLEPLACPGASGDGEGGGTINVVVAVDDCLDDAALVELAHLTGAVKGSALASLGLRCWGGGRAFGTVTDAVLIASRDCGGVRYAGPATPHGSAAATLVHDLILELGRADVSTWLRRYTGMGLGEVVDACLKAYSRAPVPGVDEEAVRRAVEEVLEQELSDPNVWAVIVAASEADAHAAEGTVPGLGRGEYVSDSPRIIADELLGAALATYINGWRGLAAYTWVDRGKDRWLGEVAEKPAFIDDVLSALIGSVLSKVYDRLVGGRGCGQS